MSEEELDVVDSAMGYAAVLRNMVKSLDLLLDAVNSAASLKSPCGQI